MIKKISSSAPDTAIGAAKIARKVAEKHSPDLKKQYRLEVFFKDNNNRSPFYVYCEKRHLYDFRKRWNNDKYITGRISTPKKTKKING